MAVDGAFKVPGLRNVELTGPYFHNGGQATLRQVAVFYERLGDFSNESLRDLDPNLASVFFTEPEEDLLVEFMRSLTDPTHGMLFAPGSVASGGADATVRKDSPQKNFETDAALEGETSCQRSRLRSRLRPCPASTASPASKSSARSLTSALSALSLTSALSARSFASFFLFS